MKIEYDDEVTVKPDYIKSEFYKEIVQNALSLKDPNLIKVECSMGSKTGENYCSFIYRVKIHFNENKMNTKIQTLSIIIKSMPDSDAADFLLSLEAFAKERSMYFEILPKLEALLAGKPHFGPSIYHSLADPIKTLIFEDMGVSNFQMASREQGFDEIHANLILKHLSKLHASSMVYAKKHPKALEKFSGGILAPAGLANNDGMIMHFLGSNAKAMIAEVSKWPGYETITKKLQNFVANFRENLIATQAPRSTDEILVLNHGDLWVNNMLFQYDKNKQPLNVVFVDFQMSIFGSPGIDLNFFFYTSLHLDLLKTKRIELLRSYHNELCHALEEMNYPQLKPSFEQLLNEFQRRASFGFFATFGILPVTSSDKEVSEDSCLENFKDEEFARKKLERMFQSKRVQETLRFALKEFDQMGIFD